MLFSAMVAPSYLPANGGHGFQFLHVLNDTCSFLFLFLFCLTAVRVGMGWYLTVVFGVHPLILIDVSIQAIVSPRWA